MKKRVDPGFGIMNRRHFLSGTAAAGFVLVGPGDIRAQEWPTKPISLVIMYAPGGGTDTLMRVIGQEMAKAKGWTIEPLSKPGAVGGIATNYVLQQPSDGHTLLGAANFNRYVRVMGHSDAVLWEDWAIFQAASSLMSWSVAAGSEFQTFDDVLAYAKENPGRLTVSTSGSGGIWHEMGMVVANAAGIDAKFVPYDGGGPASLAGLQGETQIAGGGVHEHIELLRAGKLRNIFHGGREDITLDDGTVLPSIGNFMPDLQANLPMGAEYNILARRDTPIEALRQIKEAFEAAVASDAFQEIAKKQHFDLEVLSGEQADRKAARLEAQTVAIFNRYSDQIGATVKSAEELGLPTADEFESWWPPEGYEPLDLS